MRLRFGHGLRGDSKYIGQGMLAMELPGKRRRGRLQRNFADFVKDHMELVALKAKATR